MLKRLGTFFGRVPTAPGNTGNLLEFDIPPENLLKFNWFSWKIENVGGKAGTHAVLVSWLDGTVTSIGWSSSSHAQLEIVHTLLVIVISLIKL